MRKASLWNIVIWAWVACWAVSALAQPDQAARHKLEARLIWGTNDEQFSDPKFKPVDKQTTERLRKVFVWKRYFEVNRKVVEIAEGGTQKVRMSDKCELEITPKSRTKLEVVFIGEGKKLNRMTRHFRPGESVVIGGGLRDGSAWFVVLTELKLN